jgi:hypothetical protein
MPDLIDHLQLNIAFDFANSDMLLSQPPARRSVRVTSFLFGDLKRKLKGEEFDTMEEIQSRVEELLGQFMPQTMQRVCEHWTERLRQVIHTDGDYV